MFIYKMFKDFLNWLSSAERRDIESYLSDSKDVYEVEAKMRNLERKRNFS